MKVFVVTDESGNVVGTLRQSMEMKHGDQLESDGVVAELGHTVHEVELSDVESLSPDELHEVARALIR